ncbi:sensor domain-containing diguanylate cyclase [Desulfovibrio sp. JC022]|uniref:sensor domain-containing diguanylate cyclase n=1 Tax=Desulfovibrio sp. JC022 TaxID=2593642 RepID=UPI0013D5426E|nr:sensor domain-containing diguanylate cyclase [Desulfovibrio sp. JC022]NDV21371.1 diguanylate cyclase [Desulfovibrio sp. JC022]
MISKYVTRLHSITFFLLKVMLLGLIVPLAAGLIISFELEKKEMKARLNDFNQRSLDTLIDSAEDAMVSFSPEGARNIASFLLQDERIVKIEIFSSIYDLYLLRVSKVTPEHRFKTQELKKYVVKNGEELGYVLVAVDKDWVTPRIEKERNHIIVMFVTMFVGGLLLIIPAIYFKVLRPLNRLMRQVEVLSKGELGIPYRWQGHNEFSMLGKTLDDMRTKLDKTFSLMREMAITDELTGLPNRRGFYGEVEKLLWLSGRYKHPLVLAIFDIDYFKSINDNFGHPVGDEVLKKFSEIISGRIRKTDLLARIGGEEFVLVMPETPSEDALRLLDRLRKAVAEHEFPHGEKVTVSVGFTGFYGSEKLEGLMDIADKALYKAKADGRDRVVLGPVE